MRMGETRKNVSLDRKQRPQRTRVIDHDEADVNRSLKTITWVSPRRPPTGAFAGHAPEYTSRRCFGRRPAWFRGVGLTGRHPGALSHTGEIRFLAIARRRRITATLRSVAQPVFVRREDTKNHFMAQPDITFLINILRRIFKHHRIIEEKKRQKNYITAQGEKRI